MTFEKQEKEISKRLKCIREESGMSQLDLSLVSGVSQNMITYIETGKRTPTVRTLLKLCNALGVNPSVLFEATQGEKTKVRKKIIRMLEMYM